MKYKTIVAVYSRVQTEIDVLTVLDWNRSHVDISKRGGTIYKTKSIDLNEVHVQKVH